MLAGQFRPAGFLDDVYPQASGFVNVSVLSRIEDMARQAFAARWAVVAIGENDVTRRHVAALRALGMGWRRLYIRRPSYRRVRRLAMAS